MKVQSAGRLGNQLFQWAFAANLSLKNTQKVILFSDKFHSKIDEEMLLTWELLGDDKVEFKKSDFTGCILVTIDWIVRRSKFLGSTLKRVLGVSDETDKNFKISRINRGYFQNSNYVLGNEKYLRSRLDEVLKTVSRRSKKLSEIQSNFPTYQLIHVRLGDYQNSEFGVISPESYKHLLNPKIPVLICTNGSETEVLEIVKLPTAFVIDASVLNAWETLSLMHDAEIFIGVNSTLSWWGSFLAVGQGKKSFLPNKWRKGETEISDSLLSIPGVKTYETYFL